jgi:hypothetical protein
VRFDFEDLDRAGERFDAIIGELDNLIVARTMDPGRYIFLIHFVSDTLKPVLILLEHFSDAATVWIS